MAHSSAYKKKMKTYAKKTAKSGGSMGYKAKTKNPYSALRGK